MLSLSNGILYRTELKGQETVVRYAQRLQI